MKEEKGEQSYLMVCTQLLTQSHWVVGTKIASTLVEFTGIFLVPSFYWDIEYHKRLLVPLLTGRVQCSQV
jgi:hypothetical protein